MYSYETVVEGIKYTVYFFMGFTGIIQPFTPEDPIPADEIYTNIEKYGGTNYVQGWYFESKNGPRLGIMKKIYLVAEPIEIDCPIQNTPGSYFYKLVKIGDKIGAGEEISALDAIHEIHYLRIVINQQGKQESVLHIYNNAWDINRYRYDEEGMYIDRVVEIKDEVDEIPNL